MHPVYKGPHNTDRHVTFLEIPFQNIYMCTFAEITSKENKTRSSTLISTLGTFMFIRHYLRIPIWFYILHLLICLNSAGWFAWCHVHVLPKQVSTMQYRYQFTGLAINKLNTTSSDTWCTVTAHKPEHHIECEETLTQACPQECPKVTSAFSGQSIHGILQFTMVIALRCTLHQHANQDICCWNHSYNTLHKLQPTFWWRTRFTHTAAAQQSAVANSTLTPYQCTSHISHLDVHYTNDPSAGSPTETLLRLLLPLSDKVH